MSVWQTRKQKGFTVIELLIVIVVMAILAVIVFIAYNGIRERATTTAYAAAADQWEKLLRSQYADVGSFPITSGWVCLGKSASDFPATSHLSAGQCHSAGFQFDQTIMNEFSPLVKQNIPSMPPEVTYLDTSAGQTAYARGFAYTATTSNYASIVWWVPDRSGCGRATNDITSTGGGSQCHLYLDYR